MKRALNLLSAISLLSVLLMSCSVAQSSANAASDAPENPMIDNPPATGTGFTAQYMRCGGLHSYVYGLRGFSGHNLIQLQFKSRSDNPGVPYQISLKRERWTEIALLYGYRFSSRTFRLYGAAGPAYIASEQLGALINSIETEKRVLYDNKIGRDWWITEHIREDTYEVRTHSSAGLVFDAGIGTQFSKHFYAGVGVHGALAPHGSEIGLAVMVGYGLF